MPAVTFAVKSEEAAPRARAAVDHLLRINDELTFGNDSLLPTIVRDTLGGVAPHADCDRNWWRAIGLLHRRQLLTVELIKELSLFPPRTDAEPPLNKDLTRTTARSLLIVDELLSSKTALPFDLFRSIVTGRSGEKLPPLPPLWCAEVRCMP